MTKEQQNLDAQFGWAIAIFNQWLEAEPRLENPKANLVLDWMEHARDTFLALHEDWLSHVDDAPNIVSAKQLAKHLRSLADKLEVEGYQ